MCVHEYVIYLTIYIIKYIFKNKTHYFLLLSHIYFYMFHICLLQKWASSICMQLSNILLLINIYKKLTCKIKDQDCSSTYNLYIYYYLLLLLSLTITSSALFKLRSLFYQREDREQQFFPVDILYAAFDLVSGGWFCIYAM